MIDVKNKLKQLLKTTGGGGLYVVCLTVLFIAIVFLRLPHADEGFKISDASYHVLLTMQAYDETPASVHRFLPIQTYAEKDNKRINNGPSLLQDKLGNSYYVSFSPIGFYIPYFFCKLFGLDLTLNSLYLFNCICLLISALLIYEIISELFHNKQLAGSMAIIYSFIPEILYTQGIVYWHHSISQIFLLVQMLMFFRIFLKNENNIKNWIIFWIVSFLYPYSEWTGFVSNLGLIISIFILNSTIIKKNKYNFFQVKLRCLAYIVGLASITVATLVYYIWRFTAIAPVQQVIQTLISRAEGRSSDSFITLIKGYWQSYWPLWIVFIALFVLLLALPYGRNKLFSYLKNKKAWIWLFVILFPLVENLILKQHAILYTFDRLKLALPLICLTALFIQILNLKKAKTVILQFIIVIFIIFYGCKSYGNDKIRQLTDYTDSMKLKSYLETNNILSDSILVKEGWRAWGYLQTLYHKNIYCTSIYSQNSLDEEAKLKGKRYIVILQQTDTYDDTSCYSKAKIVDMDTYTLIQAEINDGKIAIYNPTDLHAANLTDANWKDGIKRDTKKIILFNNNSLNFKKIANVRKVHCSDVEYNVLDIDYSNRWISIQVDKDATLCKFPTTIDTTM